MKLRSLAPYVLAAYSVLAPEGALASNYFDAKSEEVYSKLMNSKKGLNSRKSTCGQDKKYQKIVCLDGSDDMITRYVADPKTGQLEAVIIEERGKNKRPLLLRMSRDPDLENAYASKSPPGQYAFAKPGSTLSKMLRLSYLAAAYAAGYDPSPFSPTGYPTLSFNTPGAILNVGQKGTYPIILDDAGTLPVALQFRITTSGTFSSIGVSPGAQAIAANKTLTCAPNGTGVMCVMYDMNSNKINSGEIAQVTVQPGAPGSAALFINNTVDQYSALAADFNAYPILMTANAGLGLTISQGLSQYDVDGDNKVDLKDLQEVVAEANGSKPCGRGDINKDGVCNGLDIQAWLVPWQ